MNSEDTHIVACRDLIVAKLGWGDPGTWRQQDFDSLSDLLFDDTGTRLSSSTLKRLFGRVRYESSPNRATLDALGKFAGFENWREFQHARRSATQPSADASPTAPHNSPSRPAYRQVHATYARNSWRWSIAGCLLLAVLVFLGLRMSSKNPNGRSTGKALFSVKTVSRGLPNTVVFHYDVTGIDADSVFIQLSWDTRKRFKVDRNLHDYTATYYSPGFYKSKLIVNNTIVREQDVYISTEGWMGTIERDPVPIYLDADDLKKGIGVDTASLRQLGFDYTKQVPVVTFSNIDSTLSLDGNNLVFEATIQNTYTGDNDVCRKTAILIMGTNSVISLPVSKPGCIGELGLMLGKQFVDGKTHDLSAFGVDFTNPVKIACITRNDEVQFRINDREVYVGKLSDRIGKIVGLQIRFNGTGNVSDIKLKTNGQ